MNDNCQVYVNLIFSHIVKKGIHTHYALEGLHLLLLHRLDNLVRPNLFSPTHSLLDYGRHPTSTTDRTLPIEILLTQKEYQGRRKSSPRLL